MFDIKSVLSVTKYEISGSTLIEILVEHDWGNRQQHKSNMSGACSLDKDTNDHESTALLYFVPISAVNEN